MGNGTSSTISIDLDRINSFYFAGEMVSGTVGLNIMERKIEADEIYIILIGEVGYTTTRNVTDSNGGTTTQTDYHNIPFYSAKTILVRPEAGQKELMYGQGQYSWPFQIPLTDHLPPTINQPLTYPHVRYYLQVVIDKPWYKSNKRAARYLTIFPRVSLLQNPQYLVSPIFGNHNRKGITLKGTLNKLGYVPSEFITVTLEIKNPRRVLIQHINLSMIQSYHIGQNLGGYNIFQIILPRIINLKDEHIIETFSIPISAVSLPPSYHFQNHTYVHINYSLKFAVKVKGMFTNFDVSIPITLGTELNQQQEFNHPIVSYSSNPEQTMFDDDAPPSYDSVVQNKK